MSTRGMIGIVNKDGTVSAVYCHYDTYPTGVGKTLVENYAGDRKKMSDLVALGGLSSLGKDLDDPETDAYHRNDGEKPTISSYRSKDAFLKEVFSDIDIEYAYLMDTHSAIHGYANTFGRTKDSYIELDLAKSITDPDSTEFDLDGKPVTLE